MINKLYKISLFKSELIITLFIYILISLLLNTDAATVARFVKCYGSHDATILLFILNIIIYTLKIYITIVLYRIVKDKRNEIKKELLYYKNIIAQI